MNYCHYCSSKTSNPKFCSSKCAGASYKKDVVQNWRETGLAERSAASRLPPGVRAAILEDQNGVCALCGIEPKWNEMDLTFILDHIDGNSTDNRPENVRMICPNCDTQLPTYKGRNRGKGRHYRRERYASGQSY